MPRKAGLKGSIAKGGDWARRVVALRRKLNLSQSELGKRLNSSAMAVSRWERGVQEPPTSVYIRLGNLTGDPECWYFWGRAGLHNEDFLRVLPSVRNRLKRQRVSELRIVDASSNSSDHHQNELVVIPLLAQFAAANQGEAQGDGAGPQEGGIEAVLAVPSDWSPHPRDTSAFRVKGTSMEPLIGDGYIVIVDAGQSAPEKLYSEIIAAWHRDHGVVVSRFHRVDGNDFLIPDNRSHKPISFWPPDWRILGKVIWWMCSPNGTS